MRITKVGGIRFIRIGRLQFSYCICKRSILPPVDEDGIVSYGIIATLYAALVLS